MKGHAELTKRQLQVLPYLLACGTYEETARQAKISVKQISCWLRTSAFREELDRKRASFNKNLGIKKPNVWTFLTKRSVMCRRTDNYRTTLLKRIFQGFSKKLST
jgi:hypothetical protein